MQKQICSCVLPKWWLNLPFHGSCWQKFLLTSFLPTQPSIGLWPQSFILKEFTFCKTALPGKWVLKSLGQPLHFIFWEESLVRFGFDDSRVFGTSRILARDSPRCTATQWQSLETFERLTWTDPSTVGLLSDSLYNRETLAFKCRVLLTWEYFHM